VREHRSFSVRAPFAEDEERTAHVAPAFPWLVGHLGRVVPEARLGGWVRWIQVALGTLTAGLYFLFARRAFRSPLVALLAGLLTAADPFAIVSTATLDDGTLAAFALAGCLFLGGYAGERGGALTCLVFGLVLGSLGLVRAGFLPFAFVGLVWFLIRSRSLPSSWLCGLLAFLGFLTALAPWAVRNYQVMGEPVPVVTSTYYHLWVGNNPEATGGPVTPEMLENAPVEKLRDAKNQQARYSMLAKDVTAEVRARPVSTMRRRLYAFLAFFVGDSWLRDGTLAEWTGPQDEEPTYPAWLPRNYQGVLQGALLGMLALALLGWRWSYAWRWESMPAMLAMVWVPLPYVLGHAEALSGARLPLDGLLMCYAAFALVGLVPGVNLPLLEPQEAAKAKEE
jgi:4-amino-4-deoxy-L-arabinose transferase-like glycosyltransferase